MLDFVHVKNKFSIIRLVVSGGLPVWALQCYLWQFVFMVKSATDPETSTVFRQAKAGHQIIKYILVFSKFQYQPHAFLLSLSSSGLMAIWIGNCASINPWYISLSTNQSVLYSQKVLQGQLCRLCKATNHSNVYSVLTHLPWSTRTTERTQQYFETHTHVITCVTVILHKQSLVYE